MHLLRPPVCLVFLLAFGLLASCGPAPDPSPNVILILTDDQGWGDLGFHGNDSMQTPNLDLLAQRSLRFKNFYVSQVCAPTRASLLTGRYHLRTGTSWVTHRKEVMRSEEVTLAEVFGSAGYQTGCFGKWHNGSQFPNNPAGQGFDEFFGFAAGHWNNYFDTRLQHNNEWVETKGYLTDLLTDQAIQFIRKHANEPFFAYLAYQAPHSPFQLPDPYFKKYKSLGLTDKNAAVYGMIENLDENVGRLLKTLYQLGLEEETLVVFLSDNGPNGHRYNGGMKGIKGSVDEGGVRVPFFLRLPGKLPENREIDQTGAHIDVLPTLAELCALDLDETKPLDGISLVPWLVDPERPSEERTLFHIHTEGENRFFPTAVRTHRYRLVIERDQTARLFDMLQDPGQENDIGPRLPEVRDSLVWLVKQWFQEVSQTGIHAPPIPVGFPESPIVRLPASEALLEGNVSFQGGMGWANDYATDWQTGDAISWPLEVESGGAYALTLLGSADRTLRLEWEVQGKKNTILWEKPGPPSLIPSPDRVPRGEVYGYHWNSSQPIEIPLKKGKALLRIRLKGEDAHLQLKEALLRKI